jgi:hypothetical protein
MEIVTVVCVMRRLILYLGKYSIFILFIIYNIYNIHYQPRQHILLDEQNNLTQLTESCNKTPAQKQLPYTSKYKQQHHRHLTTQVADIN